MPGIAIIPSDLQVDGSLTPESFNCPAGAIRNTSIIAGANIDASKLERRITVTHEQEPGAAVVAKSKLAYMAKRAGRIAGVRITTTTPPTSTDTVSVDVKLGNAASAFATVLSAPVGLSNSSVARTVYAGALVTTTYVANDLFEIVVAVSGSSCQGLLVELLLEELGT